MLKVGITGNIGSGKSTLSKLFELLGAPVFYSDLHARLVMTQDAELINGIKTAFGTQSYFDDGSLNRKHIAAIVFNNEAELKKLNALVHPAVFRAFDYWLLDHRECPYVMKEAAILFESGSSRDCDRTILVTAPLEMRLQRVAARDGITHAEALSRESKQMPEAEKAKLADIIIANDNSRLIIPQVLELHRQFIASVPAHS